MTASPLRLLVVEDNPLLRAQLQGLLVAEGIEVDFAGDGLSGLQMALASPPDVLVLDLGLPGLDGLRLCERLRAEADRHVPVLMLTARDALEDKLQGFRAGADDYLVKPFEYPELAARVKALLRRSLKAASDVLTLGPLAIDFSAQAATMNGVALELTGFEYRVLEFLARERARVVSKQELSDYLYPHDEDRDSNVLEVLVGRLRRKLDPDGTLVPIETLRGRGYRLTLG